jgi:hypothetical protein
MKTFDCEECGDPSAIWHESAQEFLCPACKDGYEEFWDLIVFDGLREEEELPDLL